MKFKEGAPGISVNAESWETQMDGTIDPEEEWKEMQEERGDEADPWAGAGTDDADVVTTEESRQNQASRKQDQ